MLSGIICFILGALLGGIGIGFLAWRFWVSKRVKLILAISSDINMSDIDKIKKIVKLF